MNRSERRFGGSRVRGRVLAPAALLALALAALGGVAGATHSRFDHLSVGEINGNGAFQVSFTGASADGSRVFFRTGEPLVSADTDGFSDIYERAAGETSRLSPGNGPFIPIFQGASDDGSAVFFDTEEKVIASDEDDARDLYGAYIVP
jgi:hypothetical protein